MTSWNWKYHCLEAHFSPYIDLLACRPYVLCLRLQYPKVDSCALPPLNGLLEKLFSHPFDVATKVITILKESFFDRGKKVHCIRYAPRWMLCVI